MRANQEKGWLWASQVQSSSAPAHPYCEAQVVGPWKGQCTGQLQLVRSRTSACASTVQVREKHRLHTLITMPSLLIWLSSTA